MRDKTKTRIDEIPAELCTRKEALEILGLRTTCQHRTRSLPFSYVVYNGQRIILYNRKSVEALRYKPCPDGYVSTKEACKIIGISPKANDYLIKLLQKHSVNKIWVEAYHSYYAWKREDVECVKKLRDKTHEC